jgi:hypothetical protein
MGKRSIFAKCAASSKRVKSSKSFLALASFRCRTSGTRQAARISIRAGSGRSGYETIELSPERVSRTISVAGANLHEHQESTAARVPERQSSFAVSGTAQ